MAYVVLARQCRHSGRCGIVKDGSDVGGFSAEEPQNRLIRHFHHDIEIPLDTALCAVKVHTQAILFGGQVPFALTNAIDMTTGH